MSVFGPASRLMGRLPYKFKFMLIGGLFALAFAVLYSTLVLQVRSSLKAAESELQGLEIARPLLEAVFALQAHRDLSFGSLNGQAQMLGELAAPAAAADAAFAEAQERIARSPWRDHLAPMLAEGRERWQNLRQSGAKLAGEENFQVHSQIIVELSGTLEELAEISGLALDPEASSYYLVYASTHLAPKFTERISRLRGMGGGILASRSIEDSQQFAMTRLMGELDVIYADFGSAIGRASRSGAVDGQALGQARSAIEKDTEALRSTIKSELLEHGLDIDAPQYFERASKPLQGFVSMLFKLVVPAAQQAIEQRRERERKLLLTESAIGVVAALALTWLFIGFYRAVIRSVSELSTGAQRFADGDLAHRIEFSARDELNAVAQSFNRMAEAFASVIRAVQEESRQVSQAATELARDTGAAVEAAVIQSDKASLMAAAVEEMSVGIDEINRHAGEAERLSRNAREQATQGASVVERAARQMELVAGSVAESARTVELLGTRSAEIATVVSVIREIADQTNLLALNAAIEAARAGETGRGFAVVADEVRKLAERTGLATGEIANTVAAIQGGTHQAVASMQAGVTQVEEGVGLARAAGQSMQEISAGSDAALGAVAEISHALREQNTASQEIARNVEQIASQASETSDSMRHASSVAHGLDDMAASLRREVERFRV